MEANLNELALFAGAGGGILGGKLLGWRTVCAVEWDAYARDVLVARQNDGCLDPFPIWDDVQTFDGHPWRGRIDVVSGGFPCQDISCAGKGAGIDGERSGMWVEMARIIREVAPRYVFVENSPMLTSRGLGRVLGNLAEMGYHARWGVLGAVDAGAPHKRDRIWILAHSDLHEHRANGGKKGEQGVIPSEHRKERCARWISRTSSDSKVLADAKVAGRQAWQLHGLRTQPGQGEGLVACCGGTREGRRCDGSDSRESEQPRRTKTECGGEALADAEVLGLTPRKIPPLECGRQSLEGQFRGGGLGGSEWWQSEPDVGRVANGVAARVDRLRAIGNGQVPAVAALAWNILNQQ